MKKNTLTLLISFLVLIPVFSYAEETASTSPITEKPKITEVALNISTSTTASTTPFKDFTLCSQEAIEVRDTAIAASRSSYNVSMTNALNERKKREKASVAIQDEEKRKDAIKSSVDAYKYQAKTAQNTLTQSRKVAWQTFEDTIKVCRENQAKEEILLEQSSTSTEINMFRIDTSEPKTFKEAIKAQIESIKSLFN